MNDPQLDQESSPWRLARISLVYNLDNFALARGPGELLDPLIMAAVAAASVARLGHDPELEYRHASLAHPLPDDLRRATSVAALAASLRLPFETVRRRVKRMAADGLLVITARGVYHPVAAANGERHVEEAQARFQRARQLYRDLLTIGVVPPREMRDPPLRLHQEAPVRLCNRLVGEYTLRAIDAMMRGLGDLFRGLILLQISRVNGAHLDDLAYDPAAPLDDAQRRPVSASAIARQLRMPNETVRRHVTVLLDAGLAARTKGGLILSKEALRHSGAHLLAQENAVNLRRLFSRLDQAAVLAWWDEADRGE